MEQFDSVVAINQHEQFVTFEQSQEIISYLRNQEITLPSGGTIAFSDIEAMCPVDQATRDADPQEQARRGMQFAVDEGIPIPEHLEAAARSFVPAESQHLITVKPEATIDQADRHVDSKITDKKTKETEVVSQAQQAITDKKGAETDSQYSAPLHPERLEHNNFFVRYEHKKVMGEFLQQVIQADVDQIESSSVTAVDAVKTSSKQFDSQPPAHAHQTLPSRLKTLDVRHVLELKSAGTVISAPLSVISELTYSDEASPESDHETSAAPLALNTKIREKLHTLKFSSKPDKTNAASTETVSAPIETIPIESSGSLNNVFLKATLDDEKISNFQIDSAILVDETISSNMTEQTNIEEDIDICDKLTVTQAAEEEQLEIFTQVVIGRSVRELLLPATVVSSDAEVAPVEVAVTQVEQLVPVLPESLQFALAETLEVVSDETAIVEQHQIVTELVVDLAQQSDMLHALVMNQEIDSEEIAAVEAKVIELFEVLAEQLGVELDEKTIEGCIARIKAADYKPLIQMGVEQKYDEGMRERKPGVQRIQDFTQSLREGLQTVQNKLGWLTISAAGV